MKTDMLKTALVGDVTVKTDERIVFFGEVDELSAYIMELKHYIYENDIANFLIDIVKELSNIMSIVAGSKTDFNSNNLNKVLKEIEKYQDITTNEFVLPGQTLLSSKIHIVRTLTRKTELAYAKVYEKYGGNDFIFEYLNKLSTLFFKLALFYEKEDE